MNDQKISILNLTNEYRDCIRSLWNKYFMGRFQDSQDWELVRSYKLIKEELFQSIVLISTSEYASSNYSLGQPSPLITVKLAENYKTSVKINRNKNEVNNIRHETAGYWDHSLTELDSRAILLFVDFFDWNSYDFLNMTLVMCEILSNPDNPDVEGHRMLVDVGYVDILLELGS